MRTQRVRHQELLAVPQQPGARHVRDEPFEGRARWARYRQGKDETDQATRTDSRVAAPQRRRSTRTGRPRPARAAAAVPPATSAEERLSGTVCAFQMPPGAGERGPAGRSSSPPGRRTRPPRRIGTATRGARQRRRPAPTARSAPRRRPARRRRPGTTEQQHRDRDERDHAAGRRRDRGRRGRDHQTGQLAGPPGAGRAPRPPATAGRRSRAAAPTVRAAAARRGTASRRTRSRRRPGWPSARSAPAGRRRAPRRRRRPTSAIRCSSHPGTARLASDTSASSGTARGSASTGATIVPAQRLPGHEDHVVGST